MATAKKNTVETVAETFEVAFRDVTFTVYRDPMEWDYDAMDNLNDSKIGPALASILGASQFAKFKSLRPKAREAVELLNTIAENAGAGDSGN